MDNSINNKLIEFIRYDHRKYAHVGVLAYFFSDQDYIVMFIPSLQITSYGTTKEEAESMMREVVDSFFAGLFTMRRRKALTALYELGWYQNRIFKRKLSRSEIYVDHDGLLQEFNLPAEIQIDEEYFMS